MRPSSAGVVTAEGLANHISFEWPIPFPIIARRRRNPINILLSDIINPTNPFSVYVALHVPEAKNGESLRPIKSLSRCNRSHRGNYGS